ncbi:hypothetical protein N9D27_03030 [Gammaproteobacteria bacterium]|jgi:hypothetical protein|nr:hypothetical protein [Gammaproteobacteria bacterium]
MTDEYESFIKTEQNKDGIGVKNLSDFKTLHDLKDEISSHVDWFNSRSMDTLLSFSYQFNSEQSKLICLIQNKAYDYEEIELTAYESSSANAWNINCSFIKGCPKDDLSENVYTLDEINSLKEFTSCIRNLLMDILIDEKIGLRN